MVEQKAIHFPSNRCKTPLSTSFFFSKAKMSINPIPRFFSLSIDVLNAARYELFISFSRIDFFQLNRLVCTYNYRVFLSAINIFESRQVDVYGCIKAFFAIGEPLISNPVSWCTFSPNGREADELFYDFIYGLVDSASQKQIITLDHQ